MSTPLKIYVAVKSVPDTETKIRLGKEAFGIDGTGVKWIINPYDEFAIEEAIKTREKVPGSTVKVVSVGPAKRVAESIRTALAMGADEGVAIDAPDNLDPLATAKAIAHFIKSEGSPDLVFMGKLAIDDNSGSVPQMVAEFLEVPHIAVVSKFSIEGVKVLAERDGDGGSKQVIEVNCPVVISANKGLNTPRYASLPGIMKAKKKTILEVKLDSSIGSLSVFSELQLPPEKAPVKMLAGDAGSQANQLVQLLRSEAKVV